MIMIMHEKEILEYGQFPSKENPDKMRLQQSQKYNLNVIFLLKTIKKNPTQKGQKIILTLHSFKR